MIAVTGATGTIGRRVVRQLAEAGHGCRAAIDHQHQALDLETGHRYQQAELHWALGQSHHALGDDTNARTHWQYSIAILRDIGALTADQADALCRQLVPPTPEIIQFNT